MSGTPVSKLQTFQFYQQTGKSRDNDREPIGTASWREVADDSTIMVEVPGHTYQPFEFTLDWTVWTLMIELDYNMLSPPALTATCARERGAPA
ncbi:hypothetical protein MAPG_05693 [Magnaporthiopsis poae ATCC 64411]|uniref:Uncharacterized protein n=1 Tax=Magnaporthiopsis poae (strain ATCC 64411 / 73-15) TaxID=644358 RepID=A0A0C4E027_MAGP6|nr:hypothetical protein MAPG_05693 [Magnaporthiopsis poae ATCC 64411]